MLGFCATFTLINALCILLEVVLFLNSNYAMFAITILLQLTTTLMMFLVTATNPGVIPQYIPGYELD